MTMQLMPGDNLTVIDVMNDAVDELIEAVMGKGGKVMFVDDQILANHQRVALLLRY